MIKPDTVARGLAGEIIDLVLKNRFRVNRMRMFRFDRATAERFYEVHRGKPFFSSLVDYITSGPVVALEIVGEGVVESIREFIGTTDPAKARVGTIRYIYGQSIQQNAVHASDSPESAEKELEIVFGEP
jgi:nucleoside-diphosphate kinase